MFVCGWGEGGRWGTWADKEGRMSMGDRNTLGRKWDNQGSNQDRKITKELGRFVKDFATLCDI